MKLQYTPLRGKAPFLKDWHLKGMSFDAAFNYDATTTGCGLILGSGIVALDIDGQDAWDFYDSRWDRSLLDTSTMIWTSGREGRCQLAWSVPEEVWPFLIRKPTGPNGHLDFRWTGTQSAMPPSYHPDTKGTYMWVRNESHLTEIPFELLEFWVEECKAKTSTEQMADDNANVYASLKAMKSIIGHFHKMSPENRNIHFCKIWGIVDHNKFSADQKLQIIELHKIHDPDVMRQKQLIKKLQGK